MFRTLARSAASAAQAQPASIPKPSFRSFPVENIEHSLEKLSSEEKEMLGHQLANLQKRDWKQLSQEDMKAIYYFNWGPHGYRKPRVSEGSGKRVFLKTMAAIGAGVSLFFLIDSMKEEPPITLSKEWQEATNEYAKQNKLNPITGVASENYKGSGYVA